MICFISVGAAPGTRVARAQVICSFKLKRAFRESPFLLYFIEVGTRISTRGNLHLQISADNAVTVFSMGLLQYGASTVESC